MLDLSNIHQQDSIQDHFGIAVVWIGSGVLFNVMDHQIAFYICNSTILS